MLLYKFVPPQRATAILENSTIRFTQLAALNDPFESLPQTDGFVTKKLVFGIFDSILSDEDLMTNLIEEHYKKMYQALPAEEKQLHDFQSYRLYLKNIVDADLAYKGTTLYSYFRNILEANSDLRLKNIELNVIYLIVNNLCVLSLSTAISNDAMWSHYADSHRGLAIGFDGQDPFFSNAFQVQYQKERPKVSIFPIPERAQERLELGKKILATKNIHWQEEKEYRLINATSMLQDSHTVDNFGFPVYVATLPSQSVNEIVFGCKAQLKFKQCISEIMVSKYSKAILKETVLDNKDFQMKFKTL